MQYFYKGFHFINITIQRMHFFHRFHKATCRLYITGTQTRTLNASEKERDCTM